MKSFLILCLMALASTTSWSLNERVSSIPNAVQRPNTRRVLLLPRTGRRDVQRLFYLKHLLELNCLRHICSNAYCKGARCPAASKPLKSGGRSQVYNNRMRDNQYRGSPPFRRRYPSDDRMIVIPPNFYFINPRVENLSQLTPNTKNVQGGNLHKQNSDNVIYIQFPPQSEESRTVEEHFVGDESSYLDTEDMQKPIHDDPAKSRKTTSHSYWQEPPPDQVRQYEVEEIIDEDPVYQDRNPFYVIKKVKEETLAEELKNKPDVMRNDTGRNNSVISSNKERIRNFSNHRSRELVDEKSPQIRQEVTKYVRITPPARNPYGRVQKPPTTEPSTSSTTASPPQGKQPKRPDMLLSEPFDILEDLEFLTRQPETEKSTERMSENRKPSTLSFSEVQTTAKVVSKGFRELLTQPGKPEPDWSFPEDGHTSPSMVNMVKTVEYFSEETVNKADLTTPNFVEFTDHPLLFDLFPKVKPKENAPDGGWKNSRKMHFGDPPKSGKSNNDEQRRSDILINENDDYYDYESTFSTSNYLEKMKENSSLTAINPPKNLSADAVIRLIPIVISDLREGKIPPESFSILSEIFGKYWPAVMALSNSTNLDMLPLLKMKDEKDLENFMESHLPGNLEQATTLTTTTDKTEMELGKNIYYDLYDYDIDSYKDLYKDFSGIQDVSPTDKRKRFGKDSVQ